MPPPIPIGTFFVLTAAFCGHTAVVKLLLSRGADPRLLDNDGCTAADASEDAAVRQLLEPS